MCTVLLPPCVSPIAVNKYISYHIISYHIISYHIISYHIISYHIISYHIISHHIMSYRISYYLTQYVELKQRWACPCNEIIRALYCVISDFRGFTNEIFVLLRCYAALIGSYRRFGKTYQSHIGPWRWVKYVVSKRRRLTTNRRYVTSQKSEDLI